MSDARIPALLVDDTPLNVKLLSALLHANGFAVTPATTGEEALALATGTRFRLVLLDLRLPGLDGLEVARRLRADPGQAGVAIVAVTANAMKTDEADARAAGCDLFIAKPINTRTLIGTIADLLASQERAR